MRIGVICPSEIAWRRFMPALQLVKGIDYIGLGVCRKEECFGIQNIADDAVEVILKAEHAKAQRFIKQYGGKMYSGYEDIVRSNEIDAIYIPLPPALHFKWANKALECGKHVLLEKPATLNVADSKALVSLAEANKLALHENYMFMFHGQLDAIDDIVSSGEIGDVRLYRISFGFPMRAANDFRYDKALGGGALIDAGGYTVKYATRLLGETVKIRYAQMNYLKEYNVDIYGSAALVNQNGVTAQVAFGMDNDYKCELEVWGSKGCLTTGRVLTAPAGFAPELILKKGNTEEVIKLPADDAFQKSICRFRDCTENSVIRQESYKSMIRQAELIEEFQRLAHSKEKSNV